MVNTSCALIVDSVNKLEAKFSKLRIEEIENEDIESVEDLSGEDEADEFYSIEELDAIENKSYAFMARKFPNIRFKRN